MTDSLPDRVPTPPKALMELLQQRLLPIRSLWFPTPRELRAWEEAGVPLYLRRLRGSRFEVGPRLESMWAACFAPLYRGQIMATESLPDEQSDSEIVWSRRFPGFTIALLSVWWVILIAWPLALTLGTHDEDPAQWLPFWAFLCVASTAGPAAGWWYGGGALQEAIPWLRQALVQPPVDEDW